MSCSDGRSQRRWAVSCIIACIFILHANSGKNAWGEVMPSRWDPVWSIPQGYFGCGTAEEVPLLGVRVRVDEISEGTLAFTLARIDRGNNNHTRDVAKFTLIYRRDAGANGVNSLRIEIPDINYDRTDPGADIRTNGAVRTINANAATSANGVSHRPTPLS